MKGRRKERPRKIAGASNAGLQFQHSVESQKGQKEQSLVERKPGTSPKGKQASEKEGTTGTGPRTQNSTPQTI
jgi:hypothetical protein